MTTHITLLIDNNHIQYYQMLPIGSIQLGIGYFASPDYLTVKSVHVHNDPASRPCYTNWAYSLQVYKIISWGNEECFCRGHVPSYCSCPQHYHSGQNYYVS